MLSSLGYWTSDLLSYPLDTIITRIRVQENHLSVKDTFNIIVKQEGYRQLVRGVSLSSMTAFVPGVIYFSVY